MSHVMLALDTLGDTPDCVILAIGARRFEREAANGVAYVPKNHAFHVGIDLESNLKAGRRICELDIVTRMSLHNTAGRASFLGSKCTIKQALKEFLAWIDTDTTDEIWSMYGQVHVLEHALARHFGGELPWDKNKTRCLRTYAATLDPDMEPPPQHYLPMQQIELYFEYLQRIHEKHNLGKTNAGSKC